MSWRGDFQQLATPECLKEFIRELVSTELISEQEKFQICAKGCETTTLIECDPAVEMDFRHFEAKEINAAKIAQMNIPKQELLKEARRMVLEEEKQQKYERQQNAAFNRELRNFEEDLIKSSNKGGMRNRPDLRRSLSASKKSFEQSLPMEGPMRERRAKSTGEVEFNVAHLMPVILNDRDLRENLHQSTDSAFSSTDSSDDSTVTVLSASEREKNGQDKEFSLPPLNVNLIKPKVEVREICAKSSTTALVSITVSEQDRESLKKYWLIWRAVTFRKRNKERLEKCTQEKSDQIDQFLSQFESEQPQEYFTIGSNSSSSPKCVRNMLSSGNSSSISSKRTKSCTNLEQIIKDQKAKLREQEKLINKLKLEQIRVAAEKSQQRTQDHLENSLEDSSLPVKRKLSYLRSSFPNILDKNYYEKPRPSFLVQMEKRQKERLERKLELRERTRLRILEQKIQQKEKEESKKAELVEQKKLDHEMKLELMRQEADMRANELAAAAFCRLRRMRLGFNFFRHLLEERRRRLVEAELARETRMLETAFSKWRLSTRMAVKEKFAEARKLYQQNLTRFMWNQWRAAALNAKRDRQVAEDFHDLITQDRAFLRWRGATREAYLETKRKCDEADEHYEKLVLQKCWKAWRRLHQTLAEERKVELKKESLRNAISIILPDFRPGFIESVKHSNQL